MDNNQPPIPEANDLPPTVTGQEVPMPEVSVSTPQTTEKPAESVPAPKPKGKLIPILLIILILAILGVGGIYAYKNFFVKTPEPAPTPVSTPVSTSDPTADWETYTNTPDHFSFKYPSTWNIDKSKDGGDDRQENIEVGLTKGKAKIKIIANMVGIGGLGRDFEGLSITIDGHKLYKYTDHRSYDKTNVVGIASSLHNTIGVFEVSNKTYNIQLTYPDTYDNTEASEIEKEFDQILSTFKFTDENSTVDTSNWKTFSDAQYGIVLKYPENQYTIDNPPKIDCPTPVDDSITRCNLSVIDSCSSFECTDMITVTVYLDPNDPTYKSNLNDLSGAFSSSKIVDSNIDGIPVKMRTYPDAQQIVIAQIYYLTTSKHSYIIYGKPNDPIFNKIISTLKISK